MNYIKAQNVLPVEVIELIQKYVDGEFIYIPRKEGRQKAWGEKSGTRENLKARIRYITIYEIEIPVVPVLLSLLLIKY